MKSRVNLELAVCLIEGVEIIQRFFLSYCQALSAHILLSSPILALIARAFFPLECSFFSCKTQTLIATQAEPLAELFLGNLVSLIHRKPHTLYISKAR